MSNMQENDSKTIHVKVTVQKNGDEYIATYDPKIIQVYDSDTIINFKLDNPTPDDIVIRSVSIDPEHQSQLSTPSISKNGKQMTLSDLNTSPGTFSLSFSYRDKKDSALKLDKAGDMGVTYPQIDNNPPGFESVMAATGDGPVNNPPG